SPPPSPSTARPAPRPTTGGAVRVMTPISAPSVPPVHARAAHAKTPAPARTNQAASRDVGHAPADDLPPGEAPPHQEQPAPQEEERVEEPPKPKGPSRTRRVLRWMFAGPKTRAAAAIGRVAPNASAARSQHHWQGLS